MKVGLNRHERLVAELLGDVTPETQAKLSRVKATRAKLENLTSSRTQLLKEGQPKIPTPFIAQFSRALNARLFGEDGTIFRAEVFTAGGSGENFDGLVEIHKKGVVIATYKFLVTDDQEFHPEPNINTFYIPARSFKKGDAEYHVSPEILSHMVEGVKNSIKPLLREEGMEIPQKPERRHGKRHIVGADHQLHRMI